LVNAEVRGTASEQNAHLKDSASISHQPEFPVRLAESALRIVKRSISSCAPLLISHLSMDMEAISIHR
jgi:hypothetical protein